MTHPLASAVDFGAGAGYYGKIIRGVYPSAKLTAIEAWKPNIDRFKLASWYNEVIVDKIEDADWPDADLAIFGDVLEHMEKPLALDILRDAENAYEHIIINVPIGTWPQGAVGGNELEAHRSTFEFPELVALLPSWEIKVQIGRKAIFIRKA